MAFLRFQFIFENDQVFITITRFQYMFQLEYNERNILFFFLNVRSYFTSCFKESRGPVDS